MKYLQKSFSVGVGSDAYRANYDAIFRKEALPPPEPEAVHALECSKAGKCADCNGPAKVLPWEYDIKKDVFRDIPRGECAISYRDQFHWEGICGARARE